MNGTTRLRRVRLVLAAATIMVAGTYAAAQGQRGFARRQRPGGVELHVGQPAPDFELVPLEFEKNEKGEMVGKIGTKKIKLSAFKGKAPVCIFSSSYT